MKKLFTTIFLTLSTIFSFAQDYAYEWRGVMIDVSRHFLPIEYLYKEIDAMEHFGLNRLHLHLTDAAGWRLEIKSRPKLTDIGAWRTEWEWKTWWNGERKYSDSTNGKGGFYSQEEMKNLVDYASKHGVEIIPEIEFPAHSEEVIAAYPEVGFNHAEMDMKKPATYKLIRDVLEEVASIFPSKFLHLGGDEAATQNNIQPEGMRIVKQIVDSLNRRMIVWDEALTDQPSDSDMVIMVWRNPETAKKAISLGHDVILCPGRYCYFDKAQDAPSLEPESAGGYLPIDSVFIMPNPLDDMNHLLGIQGNIWTEHVPSPEHLEYMLWPRAFAIAEIGRIGLTNKRNVKSFHKQAIKAASYLRKSLNINAFDLKNERGQRKQLSNKNSKGSKHSSLPFTIQYNTLPHSTYPGIGNTTLIDGKTGGWSNNDGSWQGFIGSKGMDVTLDLGKKTSISEVSADFMQSCAPDIFFPYTIIISSSEDGTNFKTVLTQDHSDIYALRNEDYALLSWQCPLHTRFIRLQALPGPKSGWIFCSELFIK